MRFHLGMPQPMVVGWVETIEHHPAAYTAELHYHDVEEWLEVIRGEIAFFTISGQGVKIMVGQALNIPRGEVHRVEVGKEGVEYRMWVPIATGSDFPKKLTPEEIDLLEKNIAFPRYEDNRNNDALPFFADILSDELSFCRADGTVVDKRKFMEDGFRDRGRSSSGTPCL